MTVTIGVLSPMLGGFYFGGLLTGIEEASRQRGARVVAIQTFDPGLPDTAYQETTDFRHPVAWSHLAGLVIILNAVNDDYQKAIREARIPTVSISQDYPNLNAPAVYSDNRGGMRKAVEHLLAHGHRRIAFAGHLTQPDIQARHRAYQEVLLSRGLKPEPELTYPAGDNLFTGGYQAGRAMLDAGLPSTAVVAGTDYNAIGIIQTLVAAGCEVPKDQAVIGFDGTTEAALATPTLTTVKQEFGELGRRAVALLLDRIAGRPTRHPQFVPTTLTARESCGCPREAASPLGATRRRTDTPASRSQVRDLIRDNAYFKQLLNAQYEVGIELLLSHIDKPQALNWLHATTTTAGVLGLWARGASGDPTSLEIAGRFDRRRDTSPAQPGQSLPVARFPPEELLKRADDQPGDVVSVVPVRMRASDWGLLAVVGPIENRLSVARATTNQWAALLSVALDREAVLESLRQGKESLRRAALYDPLTGLPNRVLFADRVRAAIEEARRRPERRFAVLFLDLDGFKVVNDSLGHIAGDQLLIQVAERITGGLHPNDMAARLGGDEFAILVDDVAGARTVDTVTEQVKANLAAPFHLHGHQVVVSASIGIAEGSLRYELAQDVLRDADIAMYRAKSQAKGSYAHFDVAMHALAVSRLQTEAELRHAVEHGEFVLFYQPIVDLRSGAVAAFEALIRWQHPTRGLLAPREFIAIAEEVDLTAAIGRWALSEASRQLHTWIAAGVSDTFRVNVNVSSRQFWHADLIADVSNQLREHGVAARHLGVEITEGVIMQQSAAAGRILQQLHDYGLHVDIDDFGTGYSSLSVLLQLPIDTLKIDQSFVAKLVADRRSRELVRTIVRLARNLRMQVVAEGVETAQQREHLKQLGCRFGQGYLFSRPVPPDQATALLTRTYP